MSDEKYFKFPLAALGHDPTPLRCMERALNCAIMNAGIGTRNTDEDVFTEMLERLCEEHELDLDLDDHPDECDALVGVGIFRVTNCYNMRTLKIIATEAKKVKTGVFVAIKTEFFWSALDRLRSEGKGEAYETGALSWREFRVICAVYSVKPNGRGFSFISADAIRARAHGFLSGREMKAGEVPDSLAPRITPKQIRITLAKLEQLGFFARFRYSIGDRGGKMGFSIRLDREALGKAVLDWQGFSESEAADKWRKEDSALCRKKRRGIEE